MIKANCLGFIDGLEQHMVQKEMTLFYLLYYICISTIITFYECNYVKHVLKEMSFEIKCFMMKLAFYHLASYADEL